MAESTIKLQAQNGMSKGDLPNNTDLNNIHTAGVYLLRGTYTYTNAPSSFGILEVVKPILTNDSFVVQRITTNAHIFFRYSLSSTTWDVGKTL